MKNNKKLVKTSATVAAATVIVAGAMFSNGALASILGQQALVAASDSGTAPIGNSDSGSPNPGGGGGVVYTPVTTTNGGTTATVDPKKDTVIASSDGSFKINLPKGSFSESIKVTASIAKEADLQIPRGSNVKVVGPILNIAAEGKTHAELGATATIEVKYDPAKLSGIDPKRVAVFYESTATGEWLYQGAVINTKDNTISFTTDHFSTYAILANTNKFSDAVPTWAEESVELALGATIVDGFEDGTFKPTQNVTRAQFVQMLVKSLGLGSDEKGEISFGDVKSSDWYYNAVAIASQAGLVEGVSARSFAPSETVTREQAATFIARAYALKANGAGTELTSFKDAASVSSWAKESVTALIKAGVLDGFEDNTARPQDEVTRAQSVKLLVESLVNTGKAKVE